MMWHVLDILGWCPDITATGMFKNYENETTSTDPHLLNRRFPLQRGFAKFPVTLIAREANRLTQRLLKRTEHPAESVLVCCSPHYAPVAEKWPGRVIYYVTDLFISYGDKPNFINALERRLCAVADLVCPNSKCIAEYLINEAHCEPARIAIIPNATRSENIMAQPPDAATLSAPDDMKDLGRPVAGILGNLADNTDWLLLEEVIKRTGWLSWIFVGPSRMNVIDPLRRDARRRLQQMGGRVRFLGEKPYSQLKDFARAIDVAILPYRKCEPTYSGSSTRFYEHLATGRPMIATRGFEELLHKEPLLRLIDSADEMTSALDELRACNFRDGHEQLRCQTSQNETWEMRAAAMMSALHQRRSQRPVS
jgi:hypothetical protein